MKPEIKRLHSPDVYNLATYVPLDRQDFGFLLQVMVGPADQDGEESFDVMVCTGPWLSKHLGPQGLLIGLHHLVVNEYDYLRLEGFLRQYVSRCTGTTWKEIAEKIGRLGRWEFDDYEP